MHKGGGNAPVKIQGPYAPAPGAQMGQIRMPTGMMGRPGSQAGRESMMMMMPGGPVMMVPGGPGMGQRPKSNTHIVQPAPSPLTGQESIGKGLFSSLSTYTHCSSRPWKVLQHAVLQHLFSLLTALIHSLFCIN